MSNKVISGWLTAKLGGKFAPKTYASNVYMNSGETVESKLAGLSTDDTTTVSDGYHTPNYSEGINIATGGNGLADLYIPVGKDAGTVAEGNHTHEYITQQQLDDAINSIDFPEVNPDGSVDLTGYATQDWVNNQGFAKTSDIPTNYLTEIPSEYITETELQNKGYLTEHQSLTDYATKSWVTEEINEAKIEGGNSSVDLSAYALKADLNDYAKSTDIPDVSSFITEVPSEYVTETELADKGYATTTYVATNYAEREHTHNEYILSEDLDAAANAVTGNKYSMHCWHKKGYVYNKYNTTPSWNTQSTTVRIADAILMSNIYITLCKSISINETDGSIALGTEVRHFKLSSNQTVDSTGDPFMELIVEDSAEEVTTASGLADLLLSYDDFEGYVATGVIEEPTNVDSSSILTVTNYKVASGIVSIYQMGAKNDDAVTYSTETDETTSPYTYYECIDLLANSLSRLGAPSSSGTSGDADLDEIVYTSSSTSYTEGDNGQGLIITYLGIMDQKIPYASRLTVNQYKGTGTSTTTSIILDFEPQYIQINTSVVSKNLVKGYEYVLYPTINFGIQKEYSGTSSAPPSTSAFSFTVTENNGTYTISKLPNSSDYTYTYIALGGI